MRRLQCQLDIPGMIPLRYEGVSHCFKLMMKEEGIKGLYRGYAIHFFLSNLMLFTTTLSRPIASKAYHMANLE